MKHVRIALVVSLALVACRDPAHAPNAKPMADATVHAICKSDIGGDAATIQVWRESDGTFVTNELTKRGPDGSTIFFDDDGREMARVSDDSDTPSSPQALEAARRRELATRDGIKAEKIPCKGR